MKAYTIWFTGLPSSGKTTIATEVIKELKKKKISYVFLDDTKMRKILSPDLSDTKYEYYRHIIRLANVSYIVTANNILSIVCTVSPKRQLRTYAKQLIKNYIEVYVKCPLKVCEQRAQQPFTDFYTYYDEPMTADIILDSCMQSPQVNAQQVLDYLHKRNILKNY